MTRKHIAAYLENFMFNASQLEKAVMKNAVISTMRDIRHLANLDWDLWYVGNNEDHGRDPRDSRNRCLSFMCGEHYGVHLIEHCEADRDYNRFTMQVTMPESGIDEIDAGEEYIIKVIGGYVVRLDEHYAVIHTPDRDKATRFSWAAAFGFLDMFGEERMRDKQPTILAAITDQ